MTPGATLSMRALCLGVCGDRIHLRQVEHEAAVSNGLTGPAVTAAANGEQYTVIARELDGRADVIGARALRNQRRPPVVHAIPDCACAVVLWMTGKHDRPGHRVAELFDGRFFQLDFRTVERYRCDAGIDLGRLFATSRQECSGHTGRHRRTAKLTSIHDNPPDYSICFLTVSSLAHTSAVAGLHCTSSVSGWKVYHANQKSRVPT
jgi:hypothetical protein